MINNENDSTSVTFTQVYSDVKGALDALAESLKTGAEHVYAVLVRQQFVNSVTYLLIDVFFIIISIVAWIVIHKAYKLKAEQEKNLSEYDKGDYEALYVIPSFITLVCMLVVGITLDDVITGFINPEYGAIMEIKSFIR